MNLMSEGFLQKNSWEGLPHFTDKEIQDLKYVNIRHVAVVLAFNSQFNALFYRDTMGDLKSGMPRPPASPNQT